MTVICESNVALERVARPPASSLNFVIWYTARRQVGCTSNTKGVARVQGIVDTGVLQQHFCEPNKSSPSKNNTILKMNRGSVGAALWRIEMNVAIAVTAHTERPVGPTVTVTPLRALSVFVSRRRTLMSTLVCVRSNWTAPIHSNLGDVRGSASSSASSPLRSNPMVPNVMAAHSMRPFHVWLSNCPCILCRTLHVMGFRSSRKPVPFTFLMPCSTSLSN